MTFDKPEFRNVYYNTTCDKIYSPIPYVKTSNQKIKSKFNKPSIYKLQVIKLQEAKLQSRKPPNNEFPQLMTSATG